MPTARFRLQGLSIEGFKAFTQEQNIQVEGKHLFIFGENGCGKSSIIEAIRWCLFGVAGRQDAEVRNAFHTSNCRVELRLTGLEGELRVVRRLRPGIALSDLNITNAAGRTLERSQVFPHLARLGPREGTHIIFAAQQASSRRPQADISQFAKVLYSYLHVEDIPDLLQRLDHLLEAQRDSEQRIASDIGETEDGIRQNLSEVISKREEIVRLRPWETDSIPTVSETNSKIRQFAEELASLANAPVPPNASSRELLDHSGAWIKGLEVTNASELRQKLDSRRQTLGKLTTLWKNKKEVQNKLDETSAELHRLETEIQILSAGKTTEQFASELQLLQRHMDKAGAKLVIAGHAETYCRTYSEAACPVCSTAFAVEDLMDELTRIRETQTPQQAESLTRIQSLQKVYDDLRLIKSNLQAQINASALWNNKLSQLTDGLQSLLKLEANSKLSEDTFQRHCSSLQESIDALEDQKESHTLRFTQWTTRQKNLDGELRFQQYRKEEENLRRQLTDGLDPAKQRHKELVELIESVQEIRDELEKTFNEELERAFPELNRMMTDVYQQITRQRSFESVYVQRDLTSSERQLILKVGSKRSPGILFKPDDVLNGQAFNALGLVPYFVFSKFQAETLELDFLLIDDPSQSFDTSRTQLLLQQLEVASSHAQLFVATHEVDRFEPELAKFFPADTCIFLQVSAFDAMRGPIVEIKR